ncbi:hypothetical protein [Filifactor alocis]|uniref:hypothetical protein n=1 Tax=Filifactor alocis TaxID=143361 RepID=UPI003FA0F9C1
MSTNKQTDYNRKWQEKNKEYNSYLNARSRARGFIKSKATLDDLKELAELIQKKIQILSEKK